jgi:hypothetical protein
MCRRALLLSLVGHLVCAQARPPSTIKPIEDESALLARAREKVRASIRALPRYTCLEAIDRKYYVPPAGKHKPHMMTEIRPAIACSGNRASFLSRASLLPLDAEDRVRVEVASAGNGEIHSWPGASRFDTRPFDQLIPFGPLTTGSFGTSLIDVFANPGTQIKFAARTGDLLEYSFRVPLNVSHCYVKGSHGWQATAFSGSFAIDSTAALVRLTFETDPLFRDTKSLPICTLCKLAILNFYFRARANCKLTTLTAVQRTA